MLMLLFCRGEDLLLPPAISQAQQHLTPGKDWSGRSHPEARQRRNSDEQEKVNVLTRSSHLSALMRRTQTECQLRVCGPDSGTPETSRAIQDWRVEANRLDSCTCPKGGVVMEPGSPSQSKKRPLPQHTSNSQETSSNE